MATYTGLQNVIGAIRTDVNNIAQLAVGASGTYVVNSNADLAEQLRGFKVVATSDQPIVKINYNSGDITLMDIPYEIYINFDNVVNGSHDIYIQNCSRVVFQNFPSTNYTINTFSMTNSNVAANGNRSAGLITNIWGLSFNNSRLRLYNGNNKGSIVLNDEILIDGDNSLSLQGSGITTDAPLISGNDSGSILRIIDRNDLLSTIKTNFYLYNDMTEIEYFGSDWRTAGSSGSSSDPIEVVTSW